MRLSVPGILVGILCLACSSSFVTESMAIPGCAPVRTTNPNDQGPAGECLSAAMRGCQAQCRAANKCYHNATPPITAVPVPPAANPCQTEQGELNSCLNPLGRVSEPGGETTVVLARSGTGELRCTTKTVSYERMISAFAQGQSTSVDAVRCEREMSSAIAVFFGLPVDAIKPTSSLRRDLGLSDAELQEFAHSLGNAFGVTVNSEVVKALDSVSHLATCIGAVRAEIASTK